METNPRILIVDDELDVLLILKTALHSEGFIVEDVTSGEDALKKLEIFKYDLMIIDVMMPGMNGFELVKIARNRFPECPPILICSGLSEREKMKEALRSGVDYYIVKPFEYEELLSACWKLINGELDVKIDMETETDSSIGEQRISIGYEESISHAIALLTGRFCHDFANDILVLRGFLDASNDLGGNRERIVKRIESIDAAVRILHSYVHYFYTHSQKKLVLISKNEISRILHELYAKILGDDEILMRVYSNELDSDIQIPMILLDSLLRPCVYNAADALKSTQTNKKRRIGITIKCESGSNERRVVLNITDNGPGWGGRLQEIRNSLIMESKVKSGAPERGNGLLIIYRILYHMGGELVLDKSSKGGASIKMSFPIGVANVT